MQLHAFLRGPNGSLDVALLWQCRLRTVRVPHLGLVVNQTCGCWIRRGTVQTLEVSIVWRFSIWNCWHYRRLYFWIAPAISNSVWLVVEKPCCSPWMWPSAASSSLEITNFSFTFANVGKKLMDLNYWGNFRSLSDFGMTLTTAFFQQVG